ncbi:unnamed protein product [Adineta steineri]|uniref:Amidohydrolase-related domain-containing protein n=1 Tax=Adineta steineri TaxID=433720 RepID=A0A819VVZ3_9BILA|nr:unnamed protein product [Adineta steineri]CAF4113781.1 unnamed protein product [Adineta steineri]
MTNQLQSFDKDVHLSSRLIIQNASVLTLDEKNNYYVNATVIIENGRFKQILPHGNDFKSTKNDQVIDATGKLLMPSFVDLHFHTAVAKGWNDHLPLWEYLDECWYPSIRALDKEAAYWAAMASYMEAIKNGTGTVNDMYRQLDGLADAADEIGIRAVLSNDVALEEHNLDTLEDNVASFRNHNGRANGRIQVWFGIEWLPLANLELLKRTRQLANELGTGIHIHLNESTSEVDSTMKQFKKRPTEVAYEAGILGPDCVAAHCVHLSDAEIELLASTGTHVSHNPGSNAKLGNGIARLPEMIKAGINVGLGHDAAECSNFIDMFTVMKFASLIHRAVRQTTEVGKPDDILRMATVNGQKALGHGHELGAIVEGFKADCILIELKNTEFTPLIENDITHLTSHLVFAASGSCVDTNIIDGRIVMQNRKMLTVNEEKVVNEANKAFARIKDKMKVVARDKNKN